MLLGTSLTSPQNLWRPHEPLCLITKVHFLYFHFMILLSFCFKSGASFASLDVALMWCAFSAPLLQSKCFSLSSSILSRPSPSFPFTSLVYREEVVAINQTFNLNLQTGKEPVGHSVSKRRTCPQGAANEDLRV